MYVLGIETSCDETSCAVVKGRRVVSNVVVSSLKYHKKYGGIVPEIATRNHLKFIDKVLMLALKKAGISLKEISAIGVVYKPGLIGSLIVGVNFAKALCLSLGKPLIGINHLHSHIYAPFLNNKKRIRFPFLGLVVSGGHTELFLVKDFDNIKSVGKTRDDACGEVFDKVARAFGLGYPGGIYIDRIFREEFKQSFSFSCARIGLDFSFSGVKTAVIYKKMELEKKNKLDEETKISILSSFQESVVNTIVSTTILAAKELALNRLVCGGGVIANRRLRYLLKEETKKENIELLLSPKEYCGDNGACCAGLAFYLHKKGINSGINLSPEAN